MSLTGRIFAGKNELGKKDDDRKRSNGAVPMAISNWSWKTPKYAPRMRRRRVLYGFVAVMVLYLFFAHIPTDLGPVVNRVDRRVPGQTIAGAPLSYRGPPANEPPHSAPKTATEDRYYDEPITFPESFPMLGATLRLTTRTAGFREINKNVLFVAGNLESAARLMNMACEMDRWNRNVVHFILMGRDTPSMDTLKAANGIDSECMVYWHDARPNYGPWSTESRMESSVFLALGPIYSFIHPQVYIMDESSKEEAWVVKGLQTAGSQTGKAVIELPIDAAQRLLWMTRLDIGSLGAWGQVSVDILIQAPSGSSGSLIRLLESIQDADYFGSRRPHLTVELPPDTDQFAWRYIENMAWPPKDSSGKKHGSQLTLRRRVLPQNYGTAEASAHFIESFYPARPKFSHVLVLSPQVELSPLYYHYLIYTILEYKYSFYGYQSRQANNLIGISLHLPSHHLNDITPLEPATFQEPGATHFLWQAPESNAALYFGDKWTEFHSFLTSRMSATQDTSTSRPKVISPKRPAWTEYLLELMRIRDYNLIYPSFPSSGFSSIATVHNELYQVPEEFSNQASSHLSDPSSAKYNLEHFQADSSTLSAPPPKQHEAPLLQTSLLSILPRDGDLPGLSSLPIRTYAGDSVTTQQSWDQADKFAENFRFGIGGCKAKRLRRNNIIPMKADDLFCLGEDEAEEQEGQRLDAEELPRLGKKAGEEVPLQRKAVPMEEMSDMRSFHSRIDAAAAMPLPP
ncbi:MAG: hypothetical protein MMC33_008659 [Icmadophila ericetorum]|nr:hypothetical protein [Icmadophila ericetorum]